MKRKMRKGLVFLLVLALQTTPIVYAAGNDSEENPTKELERTDSEEVIQESPWKTGSEENDLTQNDLEEHMDTPNDLGGGISLLRRKD